MVAVLDIKVSEDMDLVEENSGEEAAGAVVTVVVIEAVARHENGATSSVFFASRKIK